MGKSEAVEPGERTRGTGCPEPPDELDLIDILVILSMARRRIAAFTVAAMILGATVSILLKPTFTATAEILSPQPTQSASWMFGQLGFMETGAPLKNPADL